MTPAPLVPIHASMQNSWRPVAVYRPGYHSSSEDTTTSFTICAVGCGRHSAAYHGPSYARYAASRPDTLLAGCCDIDEGRAREFRGRFGFTAHYTDLETMLRTCRPDAVCLIAPEPLTCELSCRILEDGYPLMVEKPPGRTVAEIDRMIAAARRHSVPTQVAFNRRYMPLVCRLKDLLQETVAPQDIQHIRYDFTRVNRRDADFSTTAIHGIDTARFLMGSDYATVHFRYQEMPDHGPGVANLFVDGAFASGVSFHLNFCPLAGVVTERATIHARDHTFFLDVPVWNAFDWPGRLLHLHRGRTAADVRGNADDEEYRVSGFYDENAAFFDDIRQGIRPLGDLRSARQSVEVAEYIRERRDRYVT